MPFILQDGRLVEVTDAQFAAFGGGEAQLRRTTAADRRRLAAEEAAAGGQNIQTTSQTNPAADQQIINPNTTNNTPGQTLTRVPAPLRGANADTSPEDTGTGYYQDLQSGSIGTIQTAGRTRTDVQDAPVFPLPTRSVQTDARTTTNIQEAPPIPGLERPRGFQTDRVSFTREELNAAGITNIPDNAPIRASADEAGAIPSGEDPYADLLDEGENITQFEGTVDQPEAIPAGEDPYVDLQDEGDNVTQFEGTVEQIEPESVDNPYQDSDELEEFGRADPDVFEPEGVDPEEDPYAQLVEETEAEDGAVEFTANGPVGRNSEELNQAAAAAKATLANARAQAALKAQRKQADDGDWRVKLRLAAGSDYLYRANDGSGGQAGILQPLVNTDGVVFPYTPTIQTNYKANYNAYELTHSNYKGYFYQGSSVDEINLTATFTAQDTYEAQYLLAVIHFFRSITKMFYGKDANAGTPPPLVFLQGLGEYQFNLHPCLVSTFTYNLPNDVDYIRARSPNQANLPAGLLQARQRQSVATNPFSAAWQRLQAAGIPKGGVNRTPAPPTLGTKSPTYVPTKIDIQLTLLPVQSRSQVTNNFSLQKYANGDLLKGGFW